MTFGENLKTLRISHSLSQKDLAEELGFSFQNISKWERNEGLPDIVTLLAIARFFDTTTDLLLGYAQEKKFSTLKIDKNKMQIYSTYPQSEEKVSNNLVFAIDSEGKIAGIVFIPHMRAYKEGYMRENHKILDEKSTIIYEYSYNFKKERIIDNKKIGIPDNGFLISVSNATLTAKQIMSFIIPEEYSAYLDEDSHSGYYNSRNGYFLFSDILKKNELDNISIEIVNEDIIFKKLTDTIEPMSVNIEILAKIVRKELQKEYSKQIEELKHRIDELEDIVDDNDGVIDDLNEQIDNLKDTIAELVVLFQQKENSETDPK